MLKPLMVENINKSKELKTISKKTQYYARAMRTAYVLSKADNIKSIIAKNALGITTFFVMLEETITKTVTKKNP
jgi:hypothetical protein